MKTRSGVVGSGRPSTTFSGQRLRRALNSIYTKPKSSSAAFSSAPNVWKEARKRGFKVTLNQVKEYLRSKATYTRHFPVRKRFHRKRIIASAIGSDWGMDLADVARLKGSNRRVTFLLVVIDSLSRKLYARGITRKTPSKVAVALEDIITEAGYAPFRIYVDKGNEFKGQEMRDLISKHQIQLILTQNDTVKSSQAERSLRNLKGRIYKHLSETGKKEYLSVLPAIVRGINNSVCRVTGLPPNQITRANEKAVWDKLFGSTSKATLSPKYPVGQSVRIRLRSKGPFTKGYEAGFSQEVFLIHRRTPGNPPTYRVKDAEGKQHPQSFYEPELVPITVY